MQAQPVKRIRLTIQGRGEGEGIACYSHPPPQGQRIFSGLYLSTCLQAIRKGHHQSGKAVASNPQSMLFGTAVVRRKNPSVGKKKDASRASKQKECLKGSQQEQKMLGKMCRNPRSVAFPFSKASKQASRPGKKFHI